MRIFPIILTVFLSACSMFKPVALYDQSSTTPEPAHIENFYALNILQDKINSEVWFTENPKCIQITNEQKVQYSGNGAIHLKWDKQEGGCDWIGMGIGWDGWSGKDLSMILNKAAIQFKAFSSTGKITSLPLAAALEDYGGKQAWCGLSANFISYKPGEEWATVTLPLSAFGWDEFDADASNIKQFVIQFESAGDVYFDAIEIVPHKGVETKTYSTIYDNSILVKVDADLTENIWKELSFVEIGQHRIQLFMTDSFLYLSGRVTDKSPMQNSFTDDQIWNGDAVEFTLSTNTEAYPKRKTLLYSDQHFGFSMNDKPQVWDWKKHQEIPGANLKVVKTSANSYQFEAKIPVKHFETKAFITNNLYDFEVAVDDGSNGKRDNQLRWNSFYKEGFNTNPSLWGKVIFNQPNE